MSAASLPILWANCVNQLKDRINNRSFWEALEHTRAITIENGTLVLGLQPEEYTRASVITQVAMLHTVHEVVRQLFGQPLKVRLIEGLGIADWEAAKAQDASLAAMKMAAPGPSSGSRRLFGLGRRHGAVVTPLHRGAFPRLAAGQSALRQ